ncbi:MAG: carbon starvation protein A [Bacteroidales bacterium]|nr:carbon starvation protein A [Bacteroidales bacterium]
MITLLISLAALVLGYLIYGAFVEKVFESDHTRTTPAYSKQDGMDYIPMPAWKVFMIQLLNIAGTGPIFGAIAGAMFGPSAYIWIVLGCIFAGATHDYLSGMLSLRHDGAGLPDLVGIYLGKKTKNVMLAFSVLLLLMVGAVFVYSPAKILGNMCGGAQNITMIWVGIVLVYYIVATMVPIDKIIGKIYPAFAIALIFMAVSLLACLIIKWPSDTPEIWDGIQNMNPKAGALFPCLFITIACGAISGFHATQSPLMARCLKNEKLGRPIFYGSMITEGAIALIWATVSSYYFYGGGIEALGDAAINPATGKAFTDAPSIVTAVCKSWLGVFGSLLAILGVVAAPITSGDTALRSARLIVADAVGLDQKPIRNRLTICVPIFIVTAALLWFSIADESGFNILWRYFGWANQSLSVFTLWALTVFLSRLHVTKKRPYYMVTLFPAALMTSVSGTFILTAKIGFNLPQGLIPYLGTGLFTVSLMLFYWWKIKKGDSCR